MKPSLEVPSKSFAHSLSQAVEAKCVTFRDYIPWADTMISRLDRPPLWISDLSTIKYRPDALRTIDGFVRSEPFEDLSESSDDYLGFLWIRYGRRELSWATFLNEAGIYSDGANGAIDCEFFYAMLNELEEADFASSVEERQRRDVERRLKGIIDRTREFYERFKKRG